AILAALYGREKTGRGERIDLALFDTTLSWLANVGQNYLVSGGVPRRQGSAHPNIVPYQGFEARHGAGIIAVGNDDQFRRFCDMISRPELAADPRFATNAARVEHRAELVPILKSIICAMPVAYWLEALNEAGIPYGKVNSIDQAFAEPQAV